MFLEYNLNILFIIILIKENKNEKLDSQKVRIDITFILFNEFFDCLNFVKKSIISWSLKIDDFISKNIEKK